MQTGGFQTNLPAQVTALPALPLLYLALLWSRLRHHRGHHWRVCLLESAVLLTMGAIAATELLGLGGWLRPGWVTIGWVAASAIACTWTWRTVSADDIWPFLKRRGSILHRHVRPWLRLEDLAVLLLIGITGVVASLSPPTNYDSMTYQLPRAMHWLQQGSTEHFPTSNFRQLAYGPGAAYWQLHLWVLADGDAAANLLQWAAFAGCGVALGLGLRRLFPAGARGLAVLTGLTLPMAVMQSGSTQTDLLTAFWLLTALALLPRPPVLRLRAVVFPGMAFGLAILTKASAALCIVPFVTLWLFGLMRRQGWARATLVTLVLAIVALLPNLPHFARNLQTFGSPLGRDGGTIITRLSPGLLAANSIRWLSLNIPNLGAWVWLGQQIEAAGINPNDPAITFWRHPYAPASPYIVQRLILPDEDFVSYTSSLVLIGVLLVLGRRGDQRHPARTELIRACLAAVFLAFLLHITVLKWQHWGNRLLLPWALTCLPVLMALGGAWRTNGLRRFVCLVLLAQAAFLLVFSLNRPWVSLPPAWRYTGDIPPLFTSSRAERFYGGYNAEVTPTAQRIVDLAKERHWRVVGLSVDWNYPEYVLWRALHEAGLGQVRIHHVNPLLLPERQLPGLRPDGFVSTPMEPPP